MVDRFANCSRTSNNCLVLPSDRVHGLTVRFASNKCAIEALGVIHGANRWEVLAHLLQSVHGCRFQIGIVCIGSDEPLG